MVDEARGRQKQDRMGPYGQGGLGPLLSIVSPETVTALFLLISRVDAC